MDEQVDMLKLLNDPGLIEELNNLMIPRTTRELSEEDKRLNRRFKRGPEDYFLENGTFTGTQFISYFKLIVDKKSSLSRNLRDCVTYYVTTAMYRIYLKNKMKEKNGTEEESRG